MRLWKRDSIEGWRERRRFGGMKAISTCPAKTHASRELRLAAPPSEERLNYFGMAGRFVHWTLSTTLFMNLCIVLYYRHISWLLLNGCEGLQQKINLFSKYWCVACACLYSAIDFTIRISTSQSKAFQSLPRRDKLRYRPRYRVQSRRKAAMQPARPRVSSELYMNCH